MVRCPKCGYPRSHVIKVMDKIAYTYRRRECNRCRKRFNTKEMTSDGWNYEVMYKEVIKQLTELVSQSKGRGINE